MVQLAISRGMPDVTSHRSQPALPSMLSGYDLVLCMERRHLESISRMLPTNIGRFRLFGHWGVGEIADPHQGTQTEYEIGLSQIDESAKRWAKKLIHLGMVN